ncbi:M1 family metallopeptidase [Pseudalkalibacillus sp. R45]|uniref:M1 family metallopeptidase n=1 Tax=Pseudalkalibacillus sp. R45 TaxID=3457433 RepID=UPI003FCD0FD4
MKKIFWVVGVLALLLGGGLFIAEDGTDLLSVFSSKHDLDDVNTTYEVDVEVFPDEKTAKATMKVYTKNDTGKTLDKIYFQVLGNKFHDLDKLTSDAWRDYLGPAPEPGGIGFTKVTLDGAVTDYSLDGTMLEIPLENWKENETIELSMEFDITVPFNEGIFSYTENNIYFANWLPIRAVYEDDGWYMNEFHPIGDSGYYEPADYTVNVTLPKAYQIASTGVETSEPTEYETKKTYEFEAKKVREFAMCVMDQTYQVKNEEVDGITIRSWYTPDSEEGFETYHRAAVEAFQHFEKSFGDYPYEEFDVVPGPRTFLGMEYPGMTVVNSDYYQTGEAFFIPTIVHEIAHQWWYAVVGNNPIEAPWLDESLTNYSTLQFLKEYEPGLATEHAKRYADKTEQLPALSRKGNTISSPTTEFQDNELYAALVYGVGPQMYYSLEKEIGIDKINEALAHYYKHNLFEFATKEDLLASFKKVVGPETEDYFNQWLEGNPVEWEEFQ